MMVKCYLTLINRGINKPGILMMLHLNYKKITIVGIWNSGETRHSDYFPQKPFEHLTQTEKTLLLLNYKERK
jgi:hypothetical protein